MILVARRARLIEHISAVKGKRKVYGNEADTKSGKIEGPAGEDTSIQIMQKIIQVKIDSNELVEDDFKLGWIIELGNLGLRGMYCAGEASAGKTWKRCRWTEMT